MKLKKKQTHSIENKLVVASECGGSIEWKRNGKFKLLGVRQVQGCIVQMENVVIILQSL